MLNENEIRRYQRHLDLAQVGESGQQKLKAAKVLIIGAGGLGCPAIQYLAAAGVGTLGVVDFDQVEESNLQRQVLFTVQDLGRNKAACAKEKIQGLNPWISCHAYEERLTRQNALALISQYDIVLDGTDNYDTKYLINDASLLAGKPMVSASIYKFEGQLSVFNFNDGPSYRCLFPRHHLTDPNGCMETGVLGVLPGILGTMQAAEALKIILGIGRVLSGKMKVINALTMEDQLILFDRNEEEIGRVREHGLEKPETREATPAETRTDDVLYVDIREVHETPELSRQASLKIPMSQLQERHVEIPRDKEVVVFCQTGKRSAQAVRFLRQTYGFDNLSNLEGGIKTLSR